MGITALEHIDVRTCAAREAGPVRDISQIVGLGFAEHSFGEQEPYVTNNKTWMVNQCKLGEWTDFEHTLG